MTREARFQCRRCRRPWCEFTTAWPIPPLRSCVFCGGAAVLRGWVSLTGRRWGTGPVDGRAAA